MDKYRPSNGTEAEDFKEDYCYRCLRWDELPGCDIFGHAWLYDVDNVGHPEEWIVEDGEAPKCTAFQEMED